MDESLESLESLVSKFMQVALVFNLAVGSKERPVDVQFIGPGCSLPIIKYRLQRLFNRKIMTSIVSYDTIGKSFESTATKAVKFRRYWENGFMSIYTDIPYLLRGRHRLGKAKQDILAARRKRFSLRMSGMSLVTLGNIAYSYFQLCNSTALFG